MSIVILDDLEDPKYDTPERRATLRYWYDRLVGALGVPIRVFGPFSLSEDPVWKEVRIMELRAMLREFARLRKLLEEVLDRDLSAYLEEKKVAVSDEGQGHEQQVG